MPLRSLARGAAALSLLSLALLPAVADAARGGAPTPSIIGGHDAPAGAWPSLVALVRDGSDPYAGQFCGGTLIAPQWVLTAAHCTDGRSAAEIDVLAGTRTLSAGGTRVTVAEIHQHPDYTPGPEHNDVSLLRLSSALPYAPIAIAGPGLEAFWRAGMTAHAAGWGNQSTSTVPEEAIWPDRLSEVDLPLVSDSACGGVWGGGFDGALMVCAMGSGVDTCQGDSGGPLTVADAAGRQVLIGATSFGSYCADPVFPGVYAEVSAFRGWIDQTIGWSRALSADSVPLTIARPAAGAASAPVTLTLTASGSAPLAISGVTLAGAGASQFAIAADTCSAGGLAVGASCTVALQATPTADADATASLVVAGDLPGGTTSFPLVSALTGPPAPDPGAGGGGSPQPTPTPTPTPASPGAGTGAGAGTTPTAPVAKRAPTATLALAARKGATRRLSLRLPAAGAVTVTVTTRCRRPVTVATAAARFTQAGTKLVALRLTRQGRRLLRADARIAATATARVTAPGATATASSLRFTLR